MGEMTNSRATIGAVKRRGVSAAPEAGVVLEHLPGGQLLPLVVRPRVDGINLAAWAGANGEIIEQNLLRHGAILFRSFALGSIDDFEQVAVSISGELAEYRFRASPRTTVKDRIYTSTDYPPSESIFPHNEHAYSPVFPLRLYFYCDIPAQKGGETPIGDTRKIFARIPPAIRERFREKGILYVRNYGDGMGLPWQTVFQSEDPAGVGEYCRKHGIDFEWKSEGRLRTRQVGPAIMHHPRTGEELWFNHGTFFHVSTLPAAVRDSLRMQFADDDLPNQTFYGDGSPIEPEVLDILRAAYRDEMVSFSWQRHDLLLLDNMLAVHARAPYEGERRVVVAMAEPVAGKDLAASPPV
ncbi:MAG TPA: TauD/TfdA family dioxygenase [Thermoanaerobaculia bacterium]|nr:TauD/TfdA family dioxygenase [Thermoanaerobaculia bacterium]